MLEKQNYQITIMKYKILIGCIIILSVSIAKAQDNTEIAAKKAKEAINLMDNGKVEESIKLLEDAQKLDPSKYQYPYEIGYAYYLIKEYKSAAKALEKAKKYEDASDLVYQLLGNSYDDAGKRSKALETYEEGLKLFPNSGYLYLEIGIVNMMEKEYNKALGYFEKGIEKAPKYASNYYWATKIYLSSTEEVWGMIYGEIFINLEPSTKRTVEISKLLFDEYKSEIKIINDTMKSVSFSKNATITLEQLQDTKNFKLPFGISCYEPTLIMSILNIKDINLVSLNSIRTQFIENYYKSEFDIKYPNILFAYQNKLNQSGHFEAYNYWLLMHGDQDAFIEWKDKNITKWENFISWFTANPIGINDSNKFYSKQY